ncbi:MAG: hypothetical protein N3F10_07070 [Candidatus Bathyarchaeota archaeon]|nr:hypothetical protein [Candidatus Bathyarchaeota archaeon]MCX8178034.1 hypothetical protein [Candidatus Bathyarchaeota archaeon]MDW8194456.1 hypothetical protein [Nitrososphaerota archaeon]
MNSKSKEDVVALLIFAFSFIYRALLMFSHSYPPGPDVGLHNSIINSIILHDGDYSWNQYHMGGGISLTHPGFHIFTSIMIFQTSLPDYIAQASVAVLFSSLMVLCAYLIVRQAWTLKSAPLTAAFLVAISRYDIEMLLWGGYPNVVTLAIMPALFYLLIKEEALSTKKFITLGSILTGSILFTHSLSSVVYLNMMMLFSVLILFSSRTLHGEIKFFIKVFSIILLGFLIAAPFIIKTFPLYLQNLGVFSGQVAENREATLLTRTVPSVVVFASLIPAISLIALTKKYSGALFRKVASLLSVWILLPAFATQSFIVGLYTDYFRLLHFLVMPVIIFLALLICHGIGYLSNFAGKVVTTRKNAITTILYGLSLTLILTTLSLSVLPIFAGPAGGFSIADYYRVVSTPEFQSILWIRKNTPQGSVFVSEHGYGWWISGFGQRATLSSTDPQFLIIPHEFEAAHVARTLLETNFDINNGLIEVREAAYSSNYNPALLVKSSNLVYPFLVMYFNDSDTIIFYRHDAQPRIIEASMIPVKDVVIEKTPESVRLSVIRGNADMSLTRKIEVNQGERSCKLSLTVASCKSGVCIDHIRLMLNAKGIISLSNKTVRITNTEFRVCGQVIFNNYFPCLKVAAYDSKQQLELIYTNFENRDFMDPYMTLEGFTFETTGVERFHPLFIATQHAPSTNITVSDYRVILMEKNVSYVAFKRVQYSVDRFLNNPAYSIVFINDRTVILKVHKLRVQGD